MVFVDRQFDICQLNATVAPPFCGPGCISCSNLGTGSVPSPLFLLMIVEQSLELRQRCWRRGIRLNSAFLVRWQKVCFTLLCWSIGGCANVNRRREMFRVDNDLRQYQKASVCRYLRPSQFNGYIAPVHWPIKRPCCLFLFGFALIVAYRSLIARDMFSFGRKKKEKSGNMPFFL